MKLLVTGGAGFLGQALLARLVGSALEPSPYESIVAVDTATGALTHPTVEYRVLDIARPGARLETIVDPPDAIVHLAAVVSGTAERDFDLGMRVNLDGTRTLLEAARSWGRGRQPLGLVFASSVAVFGGALPEVVTDTTAATPEGSYGVQKLVSEFLLGDYTRKGFVDGRSLRLPTIVVRPGAPNGAASGFASALVREPLGGRKAVCPVDPKLPMWIASPDSAVDALIHALQLPGSAFGAQRVVNLPGLTVTVAELIDALATVAGPQMLSSITYERDPAIESLVRSWPARFATARADALGFTRDRDVVELVRQYHQAWSGRLA